MGNIIYNYNNNAGCDEFIKFIRLIKIWYVDEDSRLILSRRVLIKYINVLPANYENLIIIHYLCVQNYSWVYKIALVVKYHSIKLVYNQFGITHVLLSMKIIYCILWVIFLKIN